MNNDRDRTIYKEIYCQRERGDLERERSRVIVLETQRDIKMKRNMDKYSVVCSLSRAFSCSCLFLRAMSSWQLGPMVPGFSTRLQVVGGPR